MKRTARCKSICLLLLLAVALSISCSTRTVTKAKQPKAGKTIAFITNSSSDFWRIVRKGTEKADAELADVNVVFKVPFGGTTIEQDKLVREALDQDDADAIAISPADPTKQQKIINETAKRVLLITQDSDAPHSDRALYIGADNLAAGRQAGEEIKKALPQGGKIMVFVGRKEADNARERFVGLTEALNGSKVQVLDLLTDDADSARARSNAVEAINKNPDLAGMVGLWSYNGPAIIRSVAEAKKEGKIKIVCFDEEPEVLDGVKDGTVAATIVQQPFEYGYQAVQVMAKSLKGDRAAIPESKKILIPTVVIHKDNVDDFRAKLKQLRAEK